MSQTEETVPITISELRIIQSHLKDIISGSLIPTTSSLGNTIGKLEQFANNAPISGRFIWAITEAVRKRPAKMTKDSKLFFIECSGPNVPYKTEYLKAESKQAVEKSLYNAAKYETSNYYGYRKFKVLEVDEVSVPELRSIEIDIEPKEEIKRLEGKIVYHSKSIRSIKDKIHEIRGDKCTKPVAEYGGCGGTCLLHYKCKVCKKIYLTKKALKEQQEAKERSAK